MKGSAVIPVFVAAMAPLLVLVILVSGIGIGLVAWQPPILWTSTFGAGVGPDNAAVGVSADSSGVYIAGYSNYRQLTIPGGSLHLSKFDSSGVLFWTRIIGNSSADIRAISTGAAGVYLTGDNASSGRGYIEKSDLSGSRVWLKNSTHGEGIAATATGAFMAGESTVSDYDSNGNLVWTSSLFNTTGDAPAVFANSSGVYVAGNIGGSFPGQTPVGVIDAFLLKLDLSGKVTWARQFGITQTSSYAYSVSGDSTGVYVTGTMLAGTLLSFNFLRKYDFNGNLEWIARTDSPDNSGMWDSSISADYSGVYVSIATIFPREYLLKYDSQGNQIWNLRMATPREIFSVGTAYRVATFSGATYVAGSLNEQSGSSLSTGFVSRVDPSASLILFGLNPPLSFIILAGLVGGSAVSIFIFRRLRRKRVRPKRIGPPYRTLPATD